MKASRQHKEVVDLKDADLMTMVNTNEPSAINYGDIPAVS